MRAARCQPMAAGKRRVLAASGGTPSSAKGTRSRAAGSTRTRSQCPRMVKPSPTATPFTAASRGTDMSVSRSSNPMKPPPTPSTAVPVAMAAISARSWPEVNALPLPVSTTAPTPSSSSAARKAEVTSRYMAVSNALRTSGRAKVRTRTPGAASSTATRLIGRSIVPPSSHRRRSRPSTSDRRHAPRAPCRSVAMIVLAGRPSFSGPRLRPGAGTPRDHSGHRIS